MNITKRGNPICSIHKQNNDIVTDLIRPHCGPALLPITLRGCLCAWDKRLITTLSVSQSHYLPLTSLTPKSIDWTRLNWFWRKWVLMRGCARKAASEFQRNGWVFHRFAHFPIFGSLTCLRVRRWPLVFTEEKAAALIQTVYSPTPSLPWGLRLNYIHPIKASDNLKSWSANSHVVLRLSAMKLHRKETEALSGCDEARLIPHIGFGDSSSLLGLTSHYTKSLLISKLADAWTGISSNDQHSPGGTFGHI